MIDTLTATFLAVLVVLSGGTAFALATGHQGDVTESELASGATALQQQPTQVLVFADDYTPETSFQVVTRLKQAAVRDILGQTVNDRPVVSDTSDYSGYLVDLQSSADVPGEYGLVFVDRREGRLAVGSQYQFTSDATFFMIDANLLQTGISSVDGDTTPEAETPTPDEEETPTPMTEAETPTPTTEEETPTPTPEDETPTPTPEEGTPTPEAAADGIEETTTVAEAEADGGLISSIADFIGGLFGGGEGTQPTTTAVEGGGGS